MYRRILIGGVTAAAIVGAGGTALAVSGSDTTSGTPGGATTAAATQHPAHAKKKHALLRRMAHAQIVTKGKGGFVTHDLIKGTVTAVSPTSITVQAADKTSETFVVTGDTKVRVRSAGNGAVSSIDKVTEGDRVLVAGTGTSTLTAKHVIVKK